MDWSREEVEAIVDDYLQMLMLELSGQNDNKTGHRNRLMTRLQNRSSASIEFKHGNTSAALFDLGYRIIRGYKRRPNCRPNCQALLTEVLVQRLRQAPLLEQVALAAVQMPATTPTLTDFSKVKTEPPSQGDGLGDDVLSYDTDGKERLIEVKTTGFARETPFFVSRGELALSRQCSGQFHLYRVFDFRKSPRLFTSHGRLDQHCVLDPVSYKASFT